MNPSDEALMKRCLDRWGKEFQMGMAIEECAELIMALRKYMRVREVPPLDEHTRTQVHTVTESDVISEIADVELMMQQLHVIFDSEKIDDVKLKKLARVRAGLDYESGKDICPFCGGTNVTWNWFSNETEDETVFWHECHDCPGSPSFSSRGKRGPDSQGGAPQ